MKITNLKPIKTPSRIIVGMSGGVDSSVVACLLKQQGHEVIGMFMRNWDEKDENGVCTSKQDYQDVIDVCEQLDIPYYSVDFVEEYKNNVFAQFLKEYQEGHTPNPDILCNREIKFKVFYDKAMEFGADYLATGHYCQNFFDGETHYLAKGRDPLKDQSYFLHAINGDVLEKVLFPLGDMSKSEVRKIAEENKLSVSKKKDSTGICFIGERNFKQFLSNYIKEQKGPFKRLSGEVVGSHDGTCFYTIGQRKGLGLGGPGEPWFVVAKDHQTNTIFVERGEQHPALYSDELWACEITWVTKAPKLPFIGTAKVRYRQKDQACEVFQDGHQLKVVFDEPQRAVTRRQSVVIYDGEKCLGGGVIDIIGISHFEKAKNLDGGLSLEP